MKDLKLLFESVPNFPSKRNWKKSNGITEISWYCGNAACKEYLHGAINAYASVVSAWYYNNKEKMDNIKISISDDRRGVMANIYFMYGNIGGRGVQFEGNFESVKEAKDKMYELLCKIRDDKSVFKKMSDKLASSTSLEYLSYDEFMNL